MSLFSLFKKEPAPTPNECNVIVAIGAAHVDMDMNHYDGGDLMALEDRLMEALDEANAGQFDENEYRADEVRSYFSGPDETRMLAAIQPALRQSPLGRFARIFLRRGPQGSPETELRTHD